MATTKSNCGRRFDEEFKREAATLASAPGRRDEEVARDLGVSAWSISRWRKQFGLSKAIGAGTPPSPVAAPMVPAAELARENRALRREVEELRQQREILKKALAIFSAPPR